MGGARASVARYAAGIGAALVAEAVFIVMVALISKLRGTDPWMVVRIPASLLLGPEAVRPPGFAAGDLLAGLATHALLSTLAGAIYAALLPRLRLSPVAGGLVTATVLYLLGF